MPLAFLKNARQLFCSMFLNSDLPYCFLMSGFEIMHFGQEFYINDDMTHCVLHGFHIIDYAKLNQVQLRWWPPGSLTVVAIFLFIINNLCGDTLKLGKNLVLIKLPIILASTNFFFFFFFLLIITMMVAKWWFFWLNYSFPFTNWHPWCRAFSPIPPTLPPPTTPVVAPPPLLPSLAFFF